MRRLRSSLKRIKERFRSRKGVPSYGSTAHTQLVSGNDDEDEEEEEEQGSGGSVEPKESDSDLLESKPFRSAMPSIPISTSHGDKDERATAEIEPLERSPTATLRPPSTFPPCLLAVVPDRSPMLWTFINNTLAFAGCVLLFDMAYASDQVDERPFARAFYLIWEFATCFFWTAETGLSASYQHWHLGLAKWPWYTKLEMVIAVYFTSTTLVFLVQWQVMNREIEGGDFWEIGLDTSFYVYLALRSCFRSTSSAKEGTGTRISTDYEQMQSESFLFPADEEVKRRGDPGSFV